MQGMEEVVPRLRERKDNFEIAFSGVRAWWLCGEGSGVWDICVTWYMIKELRDEGWGCEMVGRILLELSLYEEPQYRLLFLWSPRISQKNDHVITWRLNNCLGSMFVASCDVQQKPGVSNLSPPRNTITQTKGAFVGYLSWKSDCLTCMKSFPDNY